MRGVYKTYYLKKPSSVVKRDAAGIEKRRDALQVVRWVSRGWIIHEEFNRTVLFYRATLKRDEFTLLTA